jgi:hypothetical protein
MKFVNGWVDTATEYNIMQNSMSRQGYSPTHVVIHGTAGGSYVTDVASYEATHQVSTHFIIGIDGVICQEVDVSVAAWGNAPLMSPTLTFDNANVNPNYWTISIEFCKPDPTNQISITSAQLTSGIALTKLICETYGIPKKRGDGHGGIIGHCDINTVERAGCPGTFPWDALIAGINGSTPAQGGTTMSVPNGWSDNGTVLKAPNCPYEITQGFRSYILSHAWDSANIPVGSAQGLNPLELSNTSLGSGTRQLFRWSALEWTSKAGVFEGWIGQELATTVALLNRTQNDLKALQTNWNDVVAKKNALIGENTAIQKQLDDANKEIATLKATQPSGDVTQLQQQVDTLKAQNAAQAAQVQAYYNRLTQIGASATQIVTLANTK